MSTWSGDGHDLGVVDEAFLLSRSKVVLILGRFTRERKVVLDAIRDKLRKHDYLPVLFDFEKPKSQTSVETALTLARMARFVIADLTDAKSVLQELQAVVPLSPSVVVQPLLLASQEEPGMSISSTGFRGGSIPIATGSKKRY